MKATEILRHEHRTILLVIAAVEKEVASIEKTGKIHAQTVREIVDFLQSFVDRCHHGKEERHLFVIIHRRGLPMETGPLAGMLHEHELGRACVRAVAEAIAGKGALDVAAIRKARKNLAAYAQLLRAHIDKEDKVLFAMADRILDIHDQKFLCEAFEKVEAEEIGEGVHEKHHAWIEKLVGRRNRRQAENHKQATDTEQDGPVESIVAMADKALTEGSANEMIKKISGHLAEVIRARFGEALEAGKNKDKNVEAGREFVEAYGTYIYYVEGIHAAIMSAGGHRHAEAAEAEAERKEFTE